MYRFKHWFFKWMQDDEGDITIRICGFIYLTKYKEHTIIGLGQGNKYTEVNGG